MQATDMRSLSREARHERRVQVIRLRKAGRTYDEISALTGLSRTGVFDICKRHEAAGAKALRDAPGGRAVGDGRRLSAAQEAEVRKLITDRTPDQLKMPYALWTRAAVAQLIEQRFGVRLAVRTMGLYLKRWGFTPQKPLRRAYERDPAAVERWKREEYPAIVKQAKAENAEIHWGDQLGARSDHQAGRSYGRRGVTPVIPGTGQRFRANMMSSITNRGHLCFLVFEGSFNAEVFIRFCRRLLRQRRRRIFLIVDGHSVHRSAAARHWLHANRQRIRMFFLPGYSPELNPDEYLNNDVKSNAIGRQRPADKPELIANLETYLRDTQRRPNIVRSYFQAEPVQYAAG
jgi:transposase